VDKIRPCYPINMCMDPHCPYYFMNNVINELNMKDNFKCDFSKISEDMKKNSESCGEVSKMLSESMMAIYRRSAEIAQKQISESIDMIKDLSSSSSPELAYNRQQEFARSYVESNIANTKEMIDLVSKSTMEAFSTVTSKFSENMKDSMNPAHSKKSK
jgi:phasin family protein